MQKKSKVSDIIIWICWGITLLLIIVLSFSNGELSHIQSGFFSNIYLGILRFVLNRPLMDIEVSNAQFLVRKFIGHFLLFCVHGCLSIYIFNKIKKHEFLWLFWYGLVLSFLSEFLQLLAGGRTFSVLDIALDFLAFIFIAILLKFSKRSKK